MSFCFEPWWLSSDVVQLCITARNKLIRLPRHNPTHCAPTCSSSMWHWGLGQPRGCISPPPTPWASTWPEPPSVLHRGTHQHTAQPNRFPPKGVRLVRHPTLWKNVRITRKRSCIFSATTQTQQTQQALQPSPVLPPHTHTHTNHKPHDTHRQCTAPLDADSLPIPVCVDR